MGVSENGGTPKSSILIGFSIINHPFWGTPIFGNTHVDLKQNWFSVEKVRPLKCGDPPQFCGEVPELSAEKRFSDNKMQAVASKPLLPKNKFHVSYVELGYH